MNERILNLAEQAGIAIWGDAVYMYRPGDTLDSTVIIKFAELIVRECAGILMKPEYAMNHPEELGDYNKGWVNGRLLGIEHIKEHLGVEE